MNDLRSLEGIGHLLSQKMAQNNKKGGLKVKKKKGHKRSTSNPVMSNMSTPTPPTNTIAISAYFPARLAQALQNGIHVGYHQNMPTDRPNLLKSHSGFVSKDIPIPQDDMKSNRGSTSINEFQRVLSPEHSMSPPFSPVSPNTMNKLTLENQYGHGSNNSQYGNMGFVLGGNSNRNSMHAHFQGIPSSPSFRLGSFRGGSSLKLDLSEILLDGGDSMTPRQSMGSLHFPVNTDFGTMINTKENTLHNAKVDSGMSISMNTLNGHDPNNSSSTGNLSLQPNMSLPPLASPVDVEENEMQRRNALTSPKLLSSPLEMASDPPLTKPPYPLKKTYSNQSLFTLYSDDMSSTDDILGKGGGINDMAFNEMNDEEKLRKNTEANANLAPEPSVFLEQISGQNSADMFSSDEYVNNGSTDTLNGNGSTKRVSLGKPPPRNRMSSKECDIVNIDIMNLKEDFMEYQSEQRDAFNNIGNGASGIVRKAFHFRSCKMVALKQCRSKQRHETKAFINEARIYQRFEDNENITNILGFGKDKENGNLMMAMEYMDLGSADSLNIHSDVRLKIEMKELVVGHIILNTLYALNTVHRDRFVHNDIKPANILTNKYGEVKLSDFGTIGRLKDKGNQRLTKNCGTQRYQSPEKMIKQPISYTTKTDIWSLGVTAYELLFGDGYNAQDELAYITNTPKLTPKEHKLSAECCDFIQKCLIQDDDKRPTASQLIEHKWCTDIMKIDLKDKWPWLIEIEIDDEKQKEIESAIDKLGSPKNGKKAKNGKNQNGKKMVSFAEIDMNNGNGRNRKGRQQHQFYNEELLFMISALIIYYATQTVDFDSDSNDQPSLLHRRQSHINADNSQGKKIYTDNERITNMAKYAHCSKEMVLDRIRATVSYIKSQINKTEKL